jgi:hypothetical protein
LVKAKKFIVTFGDKSKHPWNEYNKGSSSIYVNGKPGPLIHLYRGFTYYFDIQQSAKAHPEHSLIFTNSPIGGPSARSIIVNLKPESRGRIGFTVTDEFPRIFFYQDTVNEMSGGMIMVNDQPPK